ncbi:MAG TPA: TIGR02147 family protein [Fibrobacteria bacterium]|nr:TIGR02147 family protein [Fibrobacteria bacterium]
MGSTAPQEPPRIFSYLDYRTFLEGFFAHRKSRDREFSLRAFARSPGLSLSSSSFISAVIKGRKNLSQNLRLRLGRAMGLEPAEMDYFELLIQFNQSKSAEEKSHYHARLARFHGSRARTLGESQHRFYARWYYGVVWHYFGLHPDHSSPARIAKNIFPSLSPEQVEEAIRVLLELKLIKKLANGYGVNDRHLAAGKAFRGAAALEHNKAFIGLALENLDRFPPSERQFNVASFSISPRGRERIKKRIDALRAEVRELAESDDGGGGQGDRIYALALQLFPCSLEEGAGALPEAMPVRTGARPAAGTSSDSGNPQE